jgi:flagellar M-ring protein FliF
MLVGPVDISPRQARGVWGRLTPPQRLTLLGVAALAVALVVAFLLFGRSPEYAVAFSNLREEDAAALVAKLKEAKIPYELADRGTTIRVPAAQVNEVRLLAAAAGLPQRGSGVGMELFNQPHLGMTEFAEKVNYQRALEAELARSIMRLDAVDSARVHLVLPQPTLFLAQQREPTASVVLSLKPGRRLDPAQVTGITQLVASSVEGLKPENVNVLDSNGALLSERGGPTDPARQTGTRQDVQRVLEQRIEAEVTRLLGRVVGPDRAIVRVSADLNWDQYEANSEIFSPEGRPPQVRSQREQREVQTQQGGRPGGVPGADANIPTYAAIQVPAGESRAERQDTQTNYELSKTVEKLVRAPGGIRRLSVAVAIDSAAITDPQQADVLSRLVATAAGLDTARGDVVTFTSLPFSQTAPVGPELEGLRQREQVLQILRLAALVLGPLVVVALVWLILRRGRRPQPAAPAISVQDAAPPLLAPAAAVEQATEAVAAAAAAAALTPSKDDVQYANAQRELVQMARNDPEAMAGLIRAWLAEERQRA